MSEGQPNGCSGKRAQVNFWALGTWGPRPTQPIPPFISMLCRVSSAVSPWSPWRSSVLGVLSEKHCVLVRVTVTPSSWMTFLFGVSNSVLAAVGALEPLVSDKVFGVVRLSESQRVRLTTNLSPQRQPAVAAVRQPKELGSKATAATTTAKNTAVPPPQPWGPTHARSNTSPNCTATAPRQQQHETRKVTTAAAAVPSSVHSHCDTPKRVIVHTRARPPARPPQSAPANNATAAALPTTTPAPPNPPGIPAQ